MIPRAVLLFHLAAAAVLWAGAPAPAAPDAEFASSPTVATAPGGLFVEFAVDRPTDVEMSILDADGRVVRHLAAGLLGPDAPAPLRPGSLRQSVLWDGKDDAGGQPGLDGLSARVRLGLRPKFDGLIGYNPQMVESVHAMTVDRDGQLYVFNVVPNIHGGDGTTVCQVFDRQGRYLRTIMPYPAGLPDGKLRGLRRLALPDGTRVPFVCQGETRSFYPGVGEIPRQRPVVTRDGRLAFVGIEEYGRYAQPGVNRVTVIHTDGSVPDEGLWRTKLHERSPSAASLALSPDEKWLYATALFDGYAGTFWDQCKWHHVVYRFGWNDAEPKPFLGTLHEAGSGPDHLSDPRSVAADAQGRLYVADRGNDRIAVFSADGKHLGDIAIEKPSWIEVHPDGPLYVMAGGPLNQLVKLSPFPEGKEQYRLTLPNTINHGRRHLWPVMAVDAAAQPPIVWAGAPSHYCDFFLLRIEDRGSRFGEPLEATRLGSAGPSVGVVTDMSLDRRGHRLYVRRRGFFDARTGAALDLKEPQLTGSGPIACFGADGDFYVYEGYPDAFIRRYDAQLRPLPFEAGGPIEGLGSPRVHGRGMTVDEAGNIYVLCQKSDAQIGPGDAKDANFLAVYGPDGRLRHARLVDSQIRQISSPRLDAAGNVYLAAGLRPAAGGLPDALERQLAGLKPWRYGMPGAEMSWYPLMLGSIVKFPPGGGSIRSDAQGPQAVFGYANTVRVGGALWIRPGASNVPSWRTPGSPDVCLCVPVRFDVDPFGRVFYPDTLRFGVGMLDAAGNLLGHFGRYGNQDSAGPASRIPEPEIALAWPQVVAVEDGMAYVADQVNRRIVRVRLACAAEARCPIPGVKP